MMNRCILIKAAAKANRLFSAALLLIYTLTMSLMVMLCFFSESIDATFQGFLKDYGLPDAYILTDGTPAALAQEMSSEPGVESVSAGMVLEMQTELPSGKVLSLRYISVENDRGIGLYNTETKERLRICDDTVAISSAFARYNGLTVGDVLTLPGGSTLTVTAIVSSPETISTARNSASWYDDMDYAFIYLPIGRLEGLTGSAGAANQFRIYLDDGADGETVLDRLTSAYGLSAVASELYEGSAVERQIRAGIDGTKALVTFLPGFIALISVLFSTLFMNQIIYSGRKEIALLRTLGHTPADISGIFICYSLLLTLLASVLGTAFGFLLLRAMLNIYRAVFDLPALRICGRVWMLGIVFAVLQLIGIVSCLLCTSGINRADPAEIFKGRGSSEHDTIPDRLSRSRLGSFSKITAASMYRSRRRLLLSALSCMACLCLNHLVIGILVSKNVGVESLFHDRLCYDAMVYCDSEAAVNSVSALPGVDAAEAHISFHVIYDGEIMRIETLNENASLTTVRDTHRREILPAETGILVEESFARRHSIAVGDVITVDGVSLQVTALTREYLYPVMYISPSQAAAWGYDECNCVAVSLSDDCSILDFSRELADIPGYGYFTDTADRESCALQTLKQLDMPCMLFLLFALVIGLLIVSNMNIISIRERSREYAALHVLGTPERRFARMVTAEGSVQLLLSCVPGIPLSLVVSRYLMMRISSVSQEYAPEKTGLVLLLACAMILLYTVLGALITLGFIRRMNVLKILSQKE